MKFINALILLLLIFPTPLLALESNDPLYDEQWYLEKIQAPSAWDIETGRSDIVVAIIDSGVDLDHPDLEGNLWTNTREIAGNGVDDDKNGYIDDIHGWDFVDDDEIPGPEVGGAATADAITHGTLVAGLVGAMGNNAEGVTGVAWNVSIMSLRMLDEEGNGNSTDAAAAMRYAVANGADIINLSFSGVNNDLVLSHAVEDAYEAGIVVVAALGNDGMNADTTPVYPACYGSDNADWVIGVAATNALDKATSFTNFGEDCVDLSAPGVDIFGMSYHDVDQGFEQAYKGGWSGTSMASPLVAGSVGLLLSAYPSLTPDAVKTVLQLSVDPVSATPALRKLYGTGRLNIANALAIAANFVEDIEISSDYIKSPSFESVYAVTETGGRRAFMNANAYFTHEDSFDAITPVADADLSHYDLEGLVLPKPGVVLVKIQSVARVYLLEENPDDFYAPILRAIDTEGIAIEMYGANWADYVIDIEPTFFTRFEQGADVLSPESVDISIMKTREELAELAL